MSVDLSPEMIARLESAQNIWISTVRPDHRPHLVPVWFVWHGGKILIGTDPNSVKINNIKHNPRVALALEDGAHPLICEGTARLVEQPWPADLVSVFFAKYEWDLHKEAQYHQVIEITPARWLSW
jgi:F420H(2)-dependent biliverdin reductase